MEENTKEIHKGWWVVVGFCQLPNACCLLDPKFSAGNQFTIVRAGHLWLGEGMRAENLQLRKPFCLNTSLTFLFCRFWFWGWVSFLFCKGVDFILRIISEEQYTKMANWGFGWKVFLTALLHSRYRPLELTPVHLHENCWQKTKPGFC